MTRGRCRQRHQPAIAIAAFVLAGCSSPGAAPPIGNHRHEVAVAWATGTTTDGFRFPIECPGPEKLLMLGNARFQLGCNASEKIKITRVDLAPDEPGSDAPEVASKKRPVPDCYLVVVPDYKTVAGVLADMRKGIVAKRNAPLDCALIRYD
jgi:hypothetical protein